MTIHIQSQSNMTAPLEPFVSLEEKFPHGGLGKKMAIKEVPNSLVVWSNTSSDDEKTVYNSIERVLMEASIKKRMVENILIDIVDNQGMEGANLLPAIQGGDYGHKGEDSGSTMDEGMPIMEAPMDPFRKIIEMDQELAALRALEEEYEAKVE
jgi:hypothetical protein